MLLNLVAEQKTSGMDPLILSVGNIGDNEKPLELEAKRLELPIKAIRFNSSFSINIIFQIRKFALANNFNLFHSHGYKFNILLGMTPRRIRGIPVVTTIHGYVHAKKFSKMWLYELLDRLFINRLDKVVVVNSAMLEHQSLNKIDKISKIYNGIKIKPSSFSNEIQKCSFNRDVPKGFRIGAIGRLSPEKGFDVLIKAFKKVSECRADVFLVILGEGSERNRLETMILDLGLKDKVFLCGFVDRAADYISELSLIVIPSYTEGLPIILLESMAERVPVIATSVGGIPEVISDADNGYLVDPGDEVKLAETIMTAINSDSKNRVLTENAYERVRKEFSSLVMHKCYLKLYQSLIK